MSLSHKSTRISSDQALPERAHTVIVGGGPTGVELAGAIAEIARTLKGKGVGFVEKDYGYHGKPLSREELKRALEGLQAGAAELAVWERRLEEIEGQEDAIDQLLAEVEAGAQPPETEGPDAELAALEGDATRHRVHLPDGGVVVGTWQDIMEQIRQARAPGETIAQFMRRTADEAQARAGVTVPAEDARSVVLAGARAGFWEIEY